MTDNFNQIEEMLEFRSEDDFYFVQVLQRKKDHPRGKVNGCNNNSRMIKYYLVHSLEYWNFIKPEIIQLCEIFQARAGINLNRRSYKKMALQHMKKGLDQILNEQYNKAHKAYSTVVGRYNHDTDKKWIIDIDEPTNRVDEYLKRDIIHHINENCRPFGKDKHITTILSKNGLHIITRPFDLLEFRKAFPNIEIHKNNPTNLYIP